MTVSRYMGTVPIKMFASGIALTGLSNALFDNASDRVLIDGAVYNPSLGSVPNIRLQGGTVFGLSEKVVNPGGPFSNIHPSWIDGTIWFQGFAPPPGPPSNTDEYTAVYYQDLPVAPGDYVPNAWSYKYQHAVRLSSIGGILRLNSEGEQCIGYCSFQSDVEVNNGIMTFSKNGGSSVVNKLNTGAISTWWAGTTVYGGRLFNRIDHYDNILLFNPGTNFSEVRKILYNSRDFTTQWFDSVTLDDDFLNTLFQEADFSLNVQTYYNGFIFTLPTGGLGPTGQPNEVLVFNSDMTQYTLVAFEPMDVESEAQLSRAGAWTVKIDQDGIFWMNSGQSADVGTVIFSFSSGFQFPILYFGNLQPITLDCVIDMLPGTLYAGG